MARITGVRSHHVLNALITLIWSEMVLRAILEGLTRGTGFSLVINIFITVEIFYEFE
jgi:hypothetical protein